MEKLTHWQREEQERKAAEGSQAAALAALTDREYRAALASDRQNLRASGAMDKAFLCQTWGEVTTGFLCGSPFGAGGYVKNKFTHRIIAKSGPKGVLREDFALRMVALRMIKSLMG